MSNEQFQAIIEKIKKLFALGKSSNEHEASLAIENARKLMLKYNIENADLAGNVEDIIELDFSIPQKFNSYHSSLSYWIGKGFNVKPIIVKSRENGKIKSVIRFIGTTSDLAAGSYVYSYLLNLIEIKSKEYFESIRYKKDKWSPLGAKKAKSDFAFGFVQGVSIKLEAMEKARKVENPYEAEVENALVIVKNANIDKYIKENLGKTKTQKSKTNYDRNHFSAGHSVGEKTGIYNGVNGRSNGQLAIGA